MKKTAVEWLVEKLEKHHTKIDIKNTVAFNQAKEMEKEQIIDAYIQKRGKRSLKEVLKCLDNAEQYYTSTYES
jgi:hypothetical protein